MNYVRLNTLSLKFCFKDLVIIKFNFEATTQFLFVFKGGFMIKIWGGGCYKIFSLEIIINPPC